MNMSGQIKEVDIMIGNLEHNGVFFDIEANIQHPFGYVTEWKPIE